MQQEHEELLIVDQLKLHAHRLVAARQVLAVLQRLVLHALVTTVHHSHAAEQRLAQVALLRHRQEHEAVAQDLLVVQAAVLAHAQEQLLHVALRVAQVLLHAAAAHHVALLEAVALAHAALAKLGANSEHI